MKKGAFALYQIKMNYQNLKFVQVCLLTSVSIYTQNKFTYAISIALSLWTSDRFLIHIILSSLCLIFSFLPQLQQLQVIYLLPFIVNLAIWNVQRRNSFQYNLKGSQILSIFLILFGFTTLNSNQIASTIQLSIFFSFLVAKLFIRQQISNKIVFCLRFLLILQAFAIIILQSDIWFLEKQKAKENWWHLISFPLALICTTFNLESPLQNKKNDEYQYTETILTESDSVDIEMQDFSQRPSSKKQLNNPGEQNFSKRSQSRSIVRIKNLSEEKQSKQSDQQANSLNLLLIIPFCLLQQSWYQIPIYFYVFSIQWGINKTWIFALALVSSGISTASYEGNSAIQILLRVLSVLLVTKSMQGGYQLGEIIRVVWLRSSFVFVLTILFWFSLLTVNIFHLLFIAIILLFITKGAGQSNNRSFRHRNWKYLVLLFNVFVITRVIYAITIGSQFLPNNHLKKILEVAGVSYYYSESDQLFNFIPLMINSIIGLQFLTYKSKIYSKQSHSNLFQNYKTLLAKLIDIMTVVYYKLLPWVSYFAIITLSLVLDASLLTFILLAWITIILGAHILLKHQLAHYKILFWLWQSYSKLVSLKIILRYAYQFIKFDIFSFVTSNTFFETILKFQQIIGLAIKNQETIYLKTVTKFQLMVSLDLMIIFIAFLVTQYYSLLIKYKQLPNDDVTGEQQDKIKKVYCQYIDFRLTEWLVNQKAYKLIKILCVIFFEIGFPILGIFCCIDISILSFLYLSLIIRYYLSLNYQYYQAFIHSGCGRSILNIVLNWNKRRQVSQNHQLSQTLANISEQMNQFKVKLHNKLRGGFVIITITAVLLTYISRTLKSQQLGELIHPQTILAFRWWLLIGGCNLQQGFIGHFSKIMLVFLIIQMKCTWFINKYYISSKLYPNAEEEVLIKNVLTEQIPRDSENSQKQGDLQKIENDQISSFCMDESEIKNQVSQIRVSLLFGSLKLLERAFVMVLIFISIVLGSHPFGVVYLLCAILLNYLGSISIKVLSRALSILVLLEYLLILSNFSNSQLHPDLNKQFSIYQAETILRSLFHLPQNWQWYITFGKNGKEIIMMTLSFIIIASYQLYFIALQTTWQKILKLAVDIRAFNSVINQKLLEHFKQIYQYGLTYSPLIIMLLCLFIYLLDYTTTNMVLTALTVGFIFISFLIRQYRQSRHFWRTYFIVLQLLIVCFMLIYSLLQLPMLSSFCNRLLCASQELHTQIYKAMLLLILQIGLDLTSSHHFDRALKKFQLSKRRIDLQKLAIAYHHNNKKIRQKFKQLKKENELSETIQNVQIFLKEVKQNPQLQFGRKGQNYQSKQSWYNFIIDFLPSSIDQYLLLGEEQARDIVIEENALWIKAKDMKQINLSINDSYMDDYGQLQGQQLEQQLRSTLENLNYQQNQQIEQVIRQEKMKQRSKSENISRESRLSSRKSFMEQILHMQSRQRVESIRKTVKSIEDKQQLIYLLLVESLLSNWHYLTYIFLLIMHIRNQGLLTIPIPAVVFAFGVVASYQAGKYVWRWLLMLVLIPLMFKFAVNVKLIEPSEELIFLLIGDNIGAVFIEFVCIVFIIGQCVILKMMGLYHQSAQQIQCMKIGIIRNIINHNRQQQKEPLYKLLRQSNYIPISFWDLLFSKAEGKPGYDYSTLLTTLQLIVLVWVFLFYDKMAIREQITFYSMIQYNQFSSGMVALTLCQLLFLLTQRFIAIVDMRSFSQRWQIGLLLKYLLLICNFLLVQIVVLIYFPISSGQYAGNSYVTGLLVINIIGLLIQSLQIKNGLDQSSRGFMDRYTWYNGFIYIGYRAIPFLFQFKAFSDWTFTKTSLRIFDWIRLQQIFGRLYVAKCNALFLAGKTLGSKIEWWKKLCMGHPLLVLIILLLFGPLVLFSSLNPLATHNDVIAGYLQVALRINKTNQYPLYTNSHITDIHRLNASAEDLRLLKLFDIQPDTVQELHLQEFSDQYWQISQGSYYKLLAQSQDSHYQLIVRAEFHRNQTGLSSLYVLKNYQIPRYNITDFKQTLKGNGQFCVKDMISTFLRLDNNNGLHFLDQQRSQMCLKCIAGVRASKQYWVLEGGLRLKMASDKFTKAIFGYSVMSFYISIILVIANYFRFLFQGTVHTIITSDIPYPDPALAICNGILRARRQHDLEREETLFWTLIDLLRSPDTLKALTGNYLQARLLTVKIQSKEQIKQD